MIRVLIRKLIGPSFLLDSPRIHKSKVRKRALKADALNSTLNRPVMAHRGNASSSHVSVNNTEQQNCSQNNNTHCSFRTTVPAHLQRIPNQRRSQNQSQNYRRQQESTMVFNPASVGNFWSYPNASPLQPSYPFSNVPFYNTQNSVLQPNLSLAYFHRQGQQRNAANTSRNGRRNYSMNGLRSWEKLSPKPSEKGFDFTVMSYNVLAQELINQHPHLYTLHDSRFLNWETRWYNLFDEIQKFKPDILCLQEVQGSHLDQYYSHLNSLGYQGVYKQRTGIRRDGCAIYYKHKILTMVEHVTVEFNQPKTSILDRDNVAIVARFFPNNNPRGEFVVATTHLLYNLKRNDVRLAQIQVLMAEIDRIAFNHNSKEHPYLPTILTGDLNSDPFSPVYEFITQGVINYENLSLRPYNSASKVLVPATLKITDQCQHANLLPHREVQSSLPRSEELKLIELKHTERELQNDKVEKSVENNPNLFSSGTLSHKFHLRSVYSHGRDNDPEGTTFQDRWLTVDYIFYSQKNGESGKLIPLERFRLPTKNQLGEMRIPNEILGSDHLSLLAKFKLIVP